MIVAATGSLAAIPKPRFQGFGVQSPSFSAGNPGLFNTGMGIGVGYKSLFSVKCFSGQAFVAIPKVGQSDDLISMDGEPRMELASQLSRT